MNRKVVVAALLLGTSSSLAIDAALAADLDVEVAGSPYTVSASESYDLTYFGNVAGSTSFTDSGFSFTTTGVARIGFTATSDANAVTFTGASAVWTGSNHLSIGYEGSDNTLSVTGGASVALDGSGDPADISLAEKAGSADNSLTVSGSGSSLTTDGTIYVGRSGSDNTMTIDGGATVSALQLRIGGGTSSEDIATGNAVVVDGADSDLTLLGTLRVGAGENADSSNNSLTISDGATVTTGKAVHLGYLGKKGVISDGNAITITGQGSKLTSHETDGNMGLNIGFSAGSKDNIVTVTDSGALDVTGKILVSSDNTLSLGDAATVAANELTMASGSKFDLDIDQDNAVDMVITKIGTDPGETGTATLAGTLTTTYSGSLNKRYTVLTAETVTGTFDTLDATDLARGFDASLSYTATEANLDFVAHLGQGDILGQNQRNVADGLNAAFNGGTTLGADFVDVYDLQGQELQSTLNLMSGEANVYGMTVGVWGADKHLLSAMRANSLSGSTGGWASVTGASTDTAGDLAAGTNATALHYAGVAGGVTFGGSDVFSAGIAVSAGQSDWTTAGIGGGDLDHAQVGGFVKADLGSAYVLASGVIGQHGLTAARASALAGDSFGLATDLDSTAVQIEAGYELALGQAVTLTPYAALSFGRATIPAPVSETGSGTAVFALDYAAQSADTQTGVIGLRLAGSLGAKTQFFTDISLSDTASNGLSAAFHTVSGSDFVVNGAGPIGPTLNAAIGAAFQITDASVATISLGGSGLSGIEDLNGSIGLRLTW
jgi:T5SS/PEP-CTERM-associated repeat protein